MAALTPAFSPESYTWMFPGCPIRFRIRLKILAASQRLVERAQGPAPQRPMAAVFFSARHQAPA
jgi:hypothetical protein